MKVCLQCEHLFSSDVWVCPSCEHEPERLNGFEAHAPKLAQSGGGFKSEYFAELSKLEASNFWFRMRNEIILWSLRKYKPDVRDFLEVGCGTGFVLSGIAKTHPEIKLFGSEIFLEGLSYASTRVPTACFMQMDARHVPFYEEFDAIGAFDVLEHIEEDESVLIQLHRALKPGGILLITVPQHPWLWSATDDYACHVRRYTCAEIEKKVRKANFKIARSTSFVTTLLPAMALSRGVQKFRRSDFDPASEFMISPLVNKLFESLMRFELWGIRLGLNYHFGGSRLIVARKQ